MQSSAAPESPRTCQLPPRTLGRVPAAFKRSRRISKGTPLKLSPRPKRQSIMGRLVGRMVGKKEKQSVEDPTSFPSSITLDFCCLNTDVQPFEEQDQRCTTLDESCFTLDSQPARPQRRGSTFASWDSMPCKPGRKESMGHYKASFD